VLLNGAGKGLIANASMINVIFRKPPARVCGYRVQDLPGTVTLEMYRQGLGGVADLELDLALRHARPARARPQRPFAA
jgi:hypothetical protein